MASRVGSGAMSRLVECVAVAGEAIDARGHILRAGDGRDRAPTPRDEVLDGTARSAPVVDVDEGRLDGSARARRDHHRDGRFGDASGERIVVVEADEEGPVDVAGGEVIADAVGVRGRRHQEDELHVARRKRQADPAKEAREERVVEQLLGGLGEHDADRSAAPGDEASGSAIGDVAKFDDGGFDRPADVAAHPGRAVHDARDGRSRDPGARGHRFEGRSVSAVAGGAVRHSVTPHCESALTLDMHDSSPCQESALTLVQGRRGFETASVQVAGEPIAEVLGPRPGAYATLRGMAETADAAPPALERYEAVIGIEVHCQLRTASKMFCGCSTAYDGARPNSHVCPVCLGSRGAAGHQPGGRRARARDGPGDRGEHP